MKLIFATHNVNKVNEIRSLRQLQLSSFEFLSLDDINYHEEIIENGTTLEENAKIKAVKIFNECNLSVFSEDTGLEVYALNNAPGVHTARYAGQDKNDKNNCNLLLSNLKKKTNRNARFRTVICYKDKQKCIYFTGICEGEITTQPVGNMGFGYDPIFIPDGADKTFAEMAIEEKNKYSHRQKAFSAFCNYLETK